MSTSKLLRNYLPETKAIGFRRKVPAMVTVNLTHRCNQHCVYCEIGMGTISVPKCTLNPDDLKWILDEMSAAGIKKISLCGGEPFLFNDLIEVVRYAGMKNIRCSITTNGMTAFRMTNDELKVLKETNTEINISMDSFDESINGMLRGVSPALENALKSARHLLNAGIPVTFLCVITKHTYSRLCEYVENASKIGIRQVLFQPVITSTNYPGEKIINNKAEINVPVDEIPLLMVQLRKILDLEKKYPVRTNVYRLLPWIGHYLETGGDSRKGWFFDKVLKKFWCREIEAIIDITYNGGIQPCGLTRAQIDIFGNRNQDLLSLWKEATEQIRLDMKKGRYYEQCNTCCNHFSRNMLASMMRYPFQNRKALITILPFIIKRML